MFEQSILPQQHAKPWMLGISLTLQASLIAAAVLVSIVNLPRLDVSVPKNPLLAPPLPKPVEFVKIVSVVRTGVAGLSVQAAARPLFAPRAIPHGVPVIEDASAAPPANIGATSSGAANVDGLAGLASVFDGSVAPPHPPSPVKAQVVPSRAPIRVSTGVMEAKIIRRVLPVYPPLAKAARIQGRVHLMGIIAKNGTIQHLQVIDGHPMLVAAAVEAVKQWVYQPTLLSGDPVEVITPIEVNFTLAQ